eukprot:scaffold12010_cov56-Isochrysis_galbana.AAC.1
MGGTSGVVPVVGAVAGSGRASPHLRDARIPQIILPLRIPHHALPRPPLPVGRGIHQIVFPRQRWHCANHRRVALEHRWPFNLTRRAEATG